MTQCRSSLFGIVEVHGHSGFWPRRKPVHYQCGVNCDAIRVENATLVVLHHMKAIATASYRPLADQSNMPSGFNWEQMLTPRKNNGR